MPKIRQKKSLQVTINTGRGEKRAVMAKFTKSKLKLIQPNSLDGQQYRWSDNIFFFFVNLVCVQANIVNIQDGNLKLRKLFKLIGYSHF